MKEARDLRSDFLKGISIFGVLWIHFGLPLSQLFKYCVPVFICIWAYFFELSILKKKDSGIKVQYAIVAKKIWLLFIPFIFWSVLYSILLHSIDEWKSTPIHTIVGGWFGGYGWAGQYFFVILFQLTSIFFLQREIVGRNNWKLLVIGGVFINLATAYFLFDYWLIYALNDRLFVYWLPYLFLGIAFARNYVPRIGFFLIFALLFMIASVPEIILLNKLKEHPAHYFAFTVSFGSVFLLMALGPRGGVEDNLNIRVPMVTKFFGVLGEASFSIFVGHNLIVILWPRVFGFYVGFWDRVAALIFSITICLLMGIAFKKINLGILIGK